MSLVTDPAKAKEYYERLKDPKFCMLPAPIAAAQGLRPRNHRCDCMRCGHTWREQDGFYVKCPKCSEGFIMRSRPRGEPSPLDHRDPMIPRLRPAFASQK